SKSKNRMLIIDTRESESLDRALKKYKKKFEKAGILRELRARQSFTKKSIRRRSEVLKAAYVQTMKRSEEA
ncbi:MAG: ribosomal protein, partial [Bacteroidetes bacterium]|nr:ribosomal protein [Bacteroidota bacterium]